MDKKFYRILKKILTVVEISCLTIIIKVFTIGQLGQPKYLKSIMPVNIKI